MANDGYPSRPVVTSTLGLVVCPHYLASEAGRQILQQGGHAVDAAIAINAALGVAYPHMTGLGGDGFWLMYQAEANQVYGLNGSGRTGQIITRQAFLDQGLTQIPPRGPLAAITVPGSVDAWWQAHQRFGRLPWSQLLEPAIALAENGYPASGSQAFWTSRNLANLTQFSEPPVPFLPAGQPPTAQQWLTNPPLASTLRRLAIDGAAAFYQGEIAHQLVQHLQAIGGWLTGADFANHTSTWVEPIKTTYRHYQICQLPPNTQGFTVLQMLNLIEPFDLGQIGHGTADYYHLLVEATKLAFADRDCWLGDPAFVDIPLEELISKGYSDRRRARLSLATAQTYQAGSIGGDTAYSAVVDGEGNAVSLLQSLYFDFGAAIVPPGLGFALQNRGALFSLQPQSANALEPGKRPFHTLIPALVLHPNGRPYLVLGTMGGEGQPQTQLALLTRVLDFGINPQTAIDLPRWLWGRTWGDTSTALTVEGRIPANLRQALEERGHSLQVAPNWTERMGHAHIIRIDPTTGLLEGGSDPRSDGVALGL